MMDSSKLYLRKEVAPMDIGKAIKKFSVEESQPIIGWRWWYVYGEGILASVVFYAEWRRPLMVADHRDCVGHLEEDAPALHHECGIHAFLDKEKAKKQRPPMIVDVIAFGQVKIFGDVVLHKFGVRGQYAIPLDCWLLAKASVPLDTRYSIKESIEQRYGINCSIYRP
jgi:hypothetical protein